MINSAKPSPAQTKSNRTSRPKDKETTRKLKQKATFIGIDLAWSERNRTGCAVIQNQRLIAYAGGLGSNQEIVTFIGTHLADECPAVIGIDAPLRVPNQTGSRLCDRTLSADWRRFEAGALPANRQIFTRMNPPTEGDHEAAGEVDANGTTNAQGGGEFVARIPYNPVRGEVLVALLTERLRFSESASIPHQTDDRLVCEIYPHPAHVSLFGLEKTLKYKSRSKRTNESRWSEFERYQTYLRALRTAKPKLKRTKSLLTQTDVRQLRGKALKEYEDTLDAITCAYVASYLWTHGPNRARTYGTLAGGHIIVPIAGEVAQQLDEH